MNLLHKFYRYIFVLGVVCIIIGTIDPLEGSVLISIGSILVAISEYFQGRPNWKWYAILSAMITFGTIALFYLSSLGGFGGSSTLSWWWGLFILPYPIGWLTLVVVLILRTVKQKQ